MMSLFAPLLHVLAAVTAWPWGLAVMLSGKLTRHPIRSIFYDRLVILVAGVALFLWVVERIKVRRHRTQLLQARLRRSIFR
jgi:hypothetical protein